METPQDQRPAIWVGLSNEILDPVPGGPARAPLILSAQDASELFRSYQHILYLTVLLSAGEGRRTLRQLTRAEAHHYELLVQEIYIGGFFSRFRFHEDVEAMRDRWDAANQAVIATIQWSSAVAEKLSASKRLAHATAKSPDVLRLVAAAALPVLQVHAGHAVDVDAEQASSLLHALAAVVRLSSHTSRRLAMRYQAMEWKPSKGEVDAVLRVDEALRRRGPARP